MSEKDKKGQLKKLQRNCKKFEKALGECKVERSHSNSSIKGLDKVEHYLKKFNQLMPEQNSNEITFSYELINEIISLWASIVEYLIRLPKNSVMPELFIVIVKIMNINQIQPLTLADFPAPDEISPQTEKLLDAYYNALAKTTLYLLLSLNISDEITQYEKKDKKVKTGSLIPPSKKKKKLSTFQFSTTIKALPIDYYEEAARLFVLISIRIPDLYESILETLNYLNGGKIGEKGGVILTEELKENYPIFKKWESYSNYISSKSSHAEKLSNAISSMDNKWLIHFEARSGFAVEYIRCWGEYIRKEIISNIKEYPGYLLFSNELMNIFEIPSEELITPIYIIAEAYGSFSCIDIEIYKKVITEKIKKTNLYDIDGMGELLIIEHFIYTYFGHEGIILDCFDFSLFESIHSCIIASDSYALICLTISMIYQVIPILPCELRKKVIFNFVLSHKLFNTLFCHWNHYVRMFFQELLLYRCTVSPSRNRIKQGSFLPKEKDIYKRISTKEIDMTKEDQNIIDKIDSRISSIKKVKEKGFKNDEDKKKSIYIVPSLQDYEIEMDDYKQWEQTNSDEPLYQILEMTRLNKLDQNTI
ncbi:hypothetical protein EHI8A_053880 [Entamoeba histolytica HM-1:IMSS-B]|uniref:Uncharacterized protein n=6 Tax=Entamoeba histolytica TaxID=5759 RepID=C4M8Z3_ENTH1|nr:hypothetical protein EHI_086570 [Entamoeba histolytica HM-1:IMSS]EMD42493.1 Hypothetical protein EHI5A_119990 [Entamoeba histolytica KU27]EMH77914.1 hypothetical protein EHI8A_053880 [Entamoeba histolytica HM-1:IMSS-B]EMS14709.1 hypothetical protein KM1_092630 [Entamoeba histolytica HM-3:IMSS]ENY63759.1 hypothetical protein EHI7A_047580 [Entamoeba histolytica HM-1:IMSS-A]GAT98098.1 hypothetical protein CL6EHI_086570 [Entamoeba histolytica]|eukprot:XP_651158.1 hypothetical protein EHI_086570 [Entamoeba histolytica HM-1:IMSS]